MSSLVSSVFRTKKTCQWSFLQKTWNFVSYFEVFEVADLVEELENFKGAKGPMIYLGGHGIVTLVYLWVWPLPSRIVGLLKVYYGFPEIENVLILVVTVTGEGPHPMHTFVGGKNPSVRPCHFGAGDHRSVLAFIRALAVHCYKSALLQTPNKCHWGWIGYHKSPRFFSTNLLLSKPISHRIWINQQPFFLFKTPTFRILCPF